jgi:GNAT superfamily N-acetyltransferase
MSTATITSRPLDGHDDVMAVHRFLADVRARTGTSRTWEVRRWEGRFWHDDPLALATEMSLPRRDIRLWTTPHGDIVAVAHPEGRGEVHLQVAPGHEDLEDEMLAWAEGALAIGGDNTTLRLIAFALDDDEDRIDLLRTRGYEPLGWGEVHLRRSLDTPIRMPSHRSGYDLRSIGAGDITDARHLADLINASFGHSFGPEALLNFEASPSFDASLQIVEVAGDGSFAAHAGVVIDRWNQLAIVEPVCTHPDHRRRGLATACMAEGLRRARERGAVRATVSTGWDNPSREVYASLGFDHVETIEAWAKTWRPGT